ncbi:MAG: biotin--[acetyl-CoA-carboxylase] ligase, partial [Magnetospirillum sp.]
MISANLPAPFKLISLDDAGSTNDEARRLSQSETAADLLVVAATTQNAGRGRRGRAWVSPAGNLHASWLIRVDSLHHAAQLGFAAASALVAALGELVPGPEFQAKWPNDVLASGRKCCGMLLESAGPHWLVLGIGVNVVAAPPPEGLNHAACSLADHGYEGGAVAVLEAFCRHFHPLLDDWRQTGFAPIRAAWLGCARGLGQPTVVRLEHDTLTGTFA